MLNKKIMFYILCLSLATLFMGIGYASINNVTLDLSGDISAKKAESIVIEDVTYKSDNLADKENSKINGFAATVLNSTVVLGSDKTSTITYEVTLSNDTDYKYQYVDTIYDEDFYDNDKITYKVEGINPNDIIAPGSEKKILITFKYKSEDITKNTLNSYLNIKFNKVYSITYENITNNNYPNLIIDGENVNITFTENAPNNIEVEGDATFEYENNILSLNNVKSDLTIKGINGATIYTLGGNLTVGSTVDPSNYNTDENSVSTTYMQYKLDSNNTVTEVDICKKSTQNAPAICLVGADTSKYNSNKEAILTYFGGSSNSMPEECSEEENYGDTEFTCANNYVVLAADTGGGVFINNIENSTSCVINPTFGIYSCKQ